MFCMSVAKSESQFSHLKESSCFRCMRIFTHIFSRPTNDGLLFLCPFQVCIQEYMMICYIVFPACKKTIRCPIGFSVCMKHDVISYRLQHMHKTIKTSLYAKLEDMQYRFHYMQVNIMTYPTGFPACKNEVLLARNVMQYHKGFPTLWCGALQAVLYTHINMIKCPIGFPTCNKTCKVPYKLLACSKT